MRSVVIIFARARTTFRHAVVANVLRELGNRLRGGPCQPVANDLRVLVQATGLNTYPDVVVVCGEPEFTDDHLNTLLNPTVIVGVLSPATEGYDRGERFAHYRRLPSLSEYVIVAQERMRVEHYARQGQQWVLSEFSAPEGVVSFPALGCELSAATTCERVVFAEPPAPEAA